MGCLLTESNGLLCYGHKNKKSQSQHKKYNEDCISVQK